MKLIIEEKDYSKVSGVEYNIQERLKKGTEHHPKSRTMMAKIQNVDYLFMNDHFCWDFGKEGDNGEHLMYLMDVIFEEQDKKGVK